MGISAQRPDVRATVANVRHPIPPEKDALSSRGPAAPGLPRRFQELPGPEQETLSRATWRKRGQPQRARPGEMPVGISPVSEGHRFAMDLQASGLRQFVRRALCRLRQQFAVPEVFEQFVRVRRQLRIAEARGGGADVVCGNGRQFLRPRERLKGDDQFDVVGDPKQPDPFVLRQRAERLPQSACSISPVTSRQSADVSPLPSTTSRSRFRCSANAPLSDAPSAARMPSEMLTSSPSLTPPAPMRRTSSPIRASSNSSSSTSDSGDGESQRNATRSSCDQAGRRRYWWAWSTCPECRDRRWTG